MIIGGIKMNKQKLQELANELNINVEKLEEERLAYNDWSGNAVMWIDFADGDVWTQVHESSDYEQKSIFVLSAKGDFYSPNQRVGLEKLLKLAKIKHDHYKNNGNRLMINELSVLDVK